MFPVSQCVKLGMSGHLRKPKAQRMQVQVICLLLPKSCVSWFYLGALWDGTATVKMTVRSQATIVGYKVTPRAFNALMCSLLMGDVWQ